MPPLRRWHSVSILCIAALVMNLSGCKHKKRQEAGLALYGEGTAFVYPLMTRLLASYQQANESVRVLYRLGEPSDRLAQYGRQKIDFVAALPLSPRQQTSSSAHSLQLPLAAGAVSIVYNLPGFEDALHLSPPVLARIFLGQIKWWNDPAIVAVNPGESLPNLPILVVHVENDAATKILVDYFQAVSPEWTVAISPISSGFAGPSAHGTEDVMAQVKQSPGAISYLELAYADLHQLPKAEIENEAGVYISPSAASTSAAVRPFVDQLAAHPETVIVDPPDDADDAYPIVGIVCLLLPKDGNDKEKVVALKNLAHFIVNAGDSTIVAMHYAPMPEEVKTEENLSIETMTVRGKRVP